MSHGITCSFRAAFHQAPDRSATPRHARRRRGGQALVEFALVIPIFLVLLIATIEFGLSLNAQLAVTFASRDAALVAAEAGNATGADCAVLRTVIDRIDSPADDNQIIDVTIYKANTVGQAIPLAAPAKNVYTRGGSMTCPLPGNASATIPFHLTGTAGFVETTRCNTLAGCGTGVPLDHIGVEIRYSYRWHTPLSGMVVLPNGGYTIDKSNSMRMEPIL